MKILYRLFLIAGLSFSLACTDLEVAPKDLASGDLVFSDFSAYESYIAKIYAGLSVSGQQGPAGNGDIKGIDEGFSQYIRTYWYLQQMTTDETKVQWGDDGIQPLNVQSWTDGNQFVEAFYYRIFYQISLVNEFIRESADDKLTERGFSTAEKAEIKRFEAEARFLRALAYYHGLDLFRNVPFFTETSSIGADAPEQGTASQVFNYIESELADIEAKLFDPKAGPYGRTDKGALWALQAKLYLNAEVYIGTAKNSEAIAASNKIINSAAYSLSANYTKNFGADNNLSPEIIFASLYDGVVTQTWGGTTFLVHAAIGGDMVPEDYGVNSGWGGIRSTSGLVNKFADITGNTDSRAIFFTSGQSKEILSLTDFRQGYAVPKYTNLDEFGNPGSDLTHPDTDFPIFRFADTYLIYAEAVVRGGAGGDIATATNYINLLRERAYGNNSGNVVSADLTLSFILDERSRELYWEGHRRTDLVRFNQFSENGIWPWKGNVQAGTTTSSYLDIFPIPASELIANPKLKQNNGY